MTNRLTYLIAVYELAEGDYYACFPDFPEMAADSGKDFDELVESSKDFLNEMIEYKIEQGEELPYPSRGMVLKAKLDPQEGKPLYFVPLTVYPPGGYEQINVTANGDVIARIVDYAKDHRITRSELMVKATLEYMRANP